VQYSIHATSLSLGKDKSLDLDPIDIAAEVFHEACATDRCDAMKKSKTKTTATRKPSKKTAGRPKTDISFRQLVITLKAASGEIEKIEHLESTGKRRDVSAAEFKTLAGTDDMDDVCGAIEDAYAAGIRDGVDEALGEELPAAQSHWQNAPESAGEQILRAGIRRIIVRRALRRGLGRTMATAAHNNGAQGTP
jgi:hypothetical protein